MSRCVYIRKRKAILKNTKFTIYYLKIRDKLEYEITKMRMRRVIRELENKNKKII